MRRFPVICWLIACPPIAAQAPPDIAFTDVTLVPLDQNRTIDHQTVVVRDGRIATIGPATKVPVARSALRIDGRGRYLMPGLADLHVHLFNSKDLLLYLANGVTTIRNLGGYGAADSILEIRRQIAAGERLGPTIYTSGNWLDGDPPVRDINTVVRTPAAARAIVEQQSAAGYDFIKVYQLLSREVYREILDAARQRGIAVTGHIPNAVGVAGVLEGGQAGVDHLAQFLGTDAPATLAPRVGRAGIAVTTTLVMLHRALSMRSAPEVVEQLLARPEARYLSPDTRRFWRNAPFIGLPPADGSFGPYRRAEELVRAFQAEGVRLLLGTDAGLWGNAPGYSAVEELGRLVESGLTPYEALRAATAEPAAFLNQHVRNSCQPGAVSEGNRADLILLEANPLEGVANVRRQAGVMVRGRWLPRARLDEMLRELADEYATADSAQ
jgi:imidazolonepropionase-like amidohydrolase